MGSSHSANLGPDLFSFHGLMSNSEMWCSVLTGKWVFPKSPLSLMGSSQHSNLGHNLCSFRKLMSIVRCDALFLLENGYFQNPFVVKWVHLNLLILVLISVVFVIWCQWWNWVLCLLQENQALSIHKPRLRVNKSAIVVICVSLDNSWK